MNSNIQGEWGIVVDKIEIQNISLPSDIQRAMATEAEESKRSKAKVNLYILLTFSSEISKVIAAEGEMLASENLKEAAKLLESSKSAIQLRFLQTLQQTSANKNHTIITPLPLELLNFLEGSDSPPG